MSVEPENFLKRIVSQGWMANVVVTVIFAALSQASLLGVILGLAAMFVLLITTARFKATAGSEPKTTGLFQTATRIGVAFATLCIASSLYVSFRPVLLSELPKQALEVVVTEATSHQGDKATIQLIPQFQNKEGGDSIFGYRQSETYQVMSAKALADRLFRDSLSSVDYVLSFFVGTLSLWFLGALIVGWCAEAFWRSDTKKQGE